MSVKDVYNNKYLPLSLSKQKSIIYYVTNKSHHPVQLQKYFSNSQRNFVYRRHTLFRKNSISDIVYYLFNTYFFKSHFSTKRCIPCLKNSWGCCSKNYFTSSSNWEPFPCNAFFNDLKMWKLQSHKSVLRGWML